MTDEFRKQFTDYYGSIADSVEREKRRMTENKIAPPITTTGATAIVHPGGIDRPAPGRCEPPPELRDRRGPHWLQHGNEQPIQVPWTGSMWQHEGRSFGWSPESMTANGYRYRCPVLSPDDLAALVRVSREMRNLLPGGGWYEVKYLVGKKADAILDLFASIAR